MGPNNLLDVRITPAWAGKSAGGADGPTAPTDHPRMGGEKFCPGVTTNSLKGSPPRGRGKAALADFGRIDHRITPA